MRSTFHLYLPILDKSYQLYHRPSLLRPFVFSLRLSQVYFLLVPNNFEYI